MSRKCRIKIMLVFSLSLIVFLVIVSLLGAIRAVPLQELRRQARSSQTSDAQALYRLASYGISLDIFLWVLISADFTLLILAAADLAWWLVTTVILFAAWLAVLRHRVGRWPMLIARYSAIPAGWLLAYLDPVLAWLAGLTRQKSFRRHTGAYEKDDLLEIIASQANQTDNRVDELDLQTALGALTFGDKTVSSVMTPKRRVKVVSADEPIGPILMDELHASGFSRFPVIRGPVKTTNWQIIGTLYLRDLIGYTGEGKTKDLMEKKVFFVNESQSLREALGAFLKTGHHMLIVTNNFEETTGVLNIEDVVEQILGEPITDEFEHYGDQRAVSGMETKKTSGHHKSD